jgi:hypothetical protein
MDFRKRQTSTATPAEITAAMNATIENKEKIADDNLHWP